MIKKRNENGKKPLAEKLLFGTGFACAQIAKAGKAVRLDKVTDLSKQAWTKTKEGTVTLGRNIKNNVADITNSFKSGYRSHDIEEQDAAPEIIKRIAPDVGSDSNKENTAPINLDFEKEIDKIDKEIADL